MFSSRPLTTVARFVIDFTMGVVLFTLVVSCVSAGNAPAFATVAHEAAAQPMSWMTALTQIQGNGWHPLTRDASILVLTISFGMITAFNMAVARSLQRVVVQTATDTDMEATHAPDHTTY